MKYLLPFFLLALTACTTVPVPDTKNGRQAWQDREILLRTLDTWSVNGRIAIMAGEDGWNAALRWQQQAEYYEIQIIAPLGQGTVSLTGDLQQVTLRASGHKGSLSAATAEELLKREMGWNMPVTSLRHWIRGVHDPGIPLQQSTFQLDSEGKLINLQQDGWDINFLRYRQVAGHQLPEKIFIENKDFRVRLIIQAWKLES